MARTSSSHSAPRRSNEEASVMVVNSISVRAGSERSSETDAISGRTSDIGTWPWPQEATSVARRHPTFAAEDSPRELASRKPGPGHEAHHRAEALCRRSADEVEARDGRLEAALEHGVALHDPKPSCERRCEQRKLPDVDPESGRQQCVVNVALAAVLERDPEPAALRDDRADRASKGEVEPGDPRAKPVAAGRPDAAVSHRLLQHLGKTTEERRDGDDPVEAWWADVRRRGQQAVDGRPVEMSSGRGEWSRPVSGRQPVNAAGTNGDGDV